MPFCHQNEYYFSCNHLLFSQWTSDNVKSNESLFPKYYFIPLYINKWDGIGIRLPEGHREGTWEMGRHKKRSPEDIAVLGAPAERRRLPTLPHCIAVPSAQVGLTSLFGMGRGGTPPQ